MAHKATGRRRRRRGRVASQAEQAAAAVTAAYIARQRLLALTLTRDLVLLVRQVFAPGVPGLSWASTKVQLGALIRDRRRVAGDLAARYYVDLRRVSLEPPRARLLRPEATARVPVVQRPAARDVVESVARQAQHRPVQPELTLEDAFGLDPLSEREAWAELDRIAAAHPTVLDADRLDANLNVTGIASFEKALRAGQTPNQAVDTMAVNLAGSATTLTLEAAREVVRDAAQADEEAFGWIRVTDEDPCSWCAMLASRPGASQGQFYRSAGTAGRDKNANFDGAGQFKWHDHCGCTAVPVFSTEDPHLRRAEDLYDLWLNETQGHSQKAAVNAWRRYWDHRDQPQDKET